MNPEPKGVQWRIQDFEKFQVCAAMPKVRSSDPSVRSAEKKSPSFFTFQDGISCHIHALHCYLVHDIVLNVDDDGDLRTIKSIQKVMTEVRSSASLAS